MSMPRTKSDRQPDSRRPDASDTHVIRDVKQLQALRSPVRQQLLTVLEHRGASSVGELAELMDMAAESLYYHVHALVRVGLVRRCGQRPGPKRPEALYDPVARRIVIDPENRSDDYLHALADVGAAALRSAERAYRRALLQVEAKRSGPERATDLRQLAVRLRPEAVAGYRQRLDALVAYLQEHDAADGLAYSMTTILCPTSAERTR